MINLNINSSINPLKLSSHVAEIELTYKHSAAASERIKASTSKSVYEVFLANWDPNTIEYIEEFKILLLNRKNHVLGIVLISKGGVSGTYVDLKLIFQAALKANASGFVCCHNHPSGGLTPSNEDIAITQRIKEASKIMSITLLDHLIISSEGYLSMVESGHI